MIYFIFPSAISLCGSIVGLLSFAGYLYLLERDCDVSNFNWVPLLSLSFTIFITSSGIMALSNMISIENFPTKVGKHRRQEVNSIIISFSSYHRFDRPV